MPLVALLAKKTRGAEIFVLRQQAREREGGHRVCLLRPASLTEQQQDRRVASADSSLTCLSVLKRKLVCAAKTLTARDTPSAPASAFGAGAVNDVSGA